MSKRWGTSCPLELVQHPNLFLWFGRMATGTLGVHGLSPLLDSMMTFLQRHLLKQLRLIYLDEIQSIKKATVYFRNKHIQSVKIKSWLNQQ